MSEKNVYKLIKPLLDYYKRDKYILIRFLYNEGYPLSKIAKILGVSVSGVSYFLSRNEGKYEK